MSKTYQMYRDKILLHMLSGFAMKVQLKLSVLIFIIYQRVTQEFTVNFPVHDGQNFLWQNFLGSSF